MRRSVPELQCSTKIVRAIRKFTWEELVKSGPIPGSKPYLQGWRQGLPEGVRSLAHVRHRVMMWSSRVDCPPMGQHHVAGVHQLEGLDGCHVRGTC
eukprot:7966954-Pyramimonas_sp.AAC.2